MKSLKDTFIFKSYEKYGLDKIIKTFITKGRYVEKDELSYETGTINKFFKYPLKTRVMKTFEEGNTFKIIVLPKGIKEKMPTSVPFLIADPETPNARAYIFADNFATIDKDDAVSIEPKKLYCLLESAYIGCTYAKNTTALNNNAEFITTCAKIYAALFIRVLNKRYALNIDQRAFAKVNYLSAKFCMINLFGKPDNDTINNYAMKIADIASPTSVYDVDNAFTADSFSGIDKFIQAIAANAYLLNDGLHKLTVREFIEEYVNTYHPSTAFALEHPIYFLFMIDAVTIGAYMNNQMLLEDIIGKDGARIYVAFDKF